MVFYAIFASGGLDKTLLWVYVNGEKIREIQFDQKYQTWSAMFTGDSRIQVEVEKILE